MNKNNDSIGLPASSTSLENGTAGVESSSSAPNHQNSFINKKKKHLQNLNDRFSSYIERVRHLELENARLHREADEIREFGINEKLRVRTECETELSNLRRNLDEASREKAKLEIDSKRLEEQRDSFLLKCDKKLAALFETDGKNNELNARYHKMVKKYNEVVVGLKEYSEMSEKLQAQQHDLCHETEHTRRDLESATLARVDFENMIQSLNEEITFKESIFDQQRHDLSETKHQRELEYNDMATILGQEYESKLQQSLDKLKVQYEDELRRKCDESHVKYQNKLKKMQIEIEKSNNRKILEDLRVAKKQLDDLTERSEDLASSNDKLNIRLNKLNNDLESERKENANIVRQMKKEIRSMNDESAKQLKEYSDLLDVKMSLDLELSTYDKLLKVEESRLNITPSTTSESDIYFELNEPASSGNAADELTQSNGDHILSDKNTKQIKSEPETEYENSSDRKRKRYTASKDKENLTAEIKKENSNSSESNNVNNATKKKSFFKF